MNHRGDVPAPVSDRERTADVMVCSGSRPAASACAIVRQSHWAVAPIAAPANSGGRAARSVGSVAGSAGRLGQVLPDDVQRAQVVSTAPVPEPQVRPRELRAVALDDVREDRHRLALLLRVGVLGQPARNRSSVAWRSSSDAGSGTGLGSALRGLQTPNAVFFCTPRVIAEYSHCLDSAPASLNRRARCARVDTLRASVPVFA